MLAPIVLFVYNRPWHTRKTLESLEKNDLAKESELFIFSDGPKENASKEQLKKISETRRVVREKEWCGKINIVEKEKNVGLANSVISGVTEIVNKFGKIIVLEDDFILSKNFLKYMNDALERFEKEEKVMQVSGYMYPVDNSMEKDAFFLPFITTWGWGTWKRAWDKFDRSGKKIEMLRGDKDLRKKFNLGGAYPYYKMLKAQIDKGIDSWGIRFYLSVFIQNGLAVFPRKTLVNNIGFDGSGVHCKIEIEQDGIDNDFSVKNFDVMQIAPDAMKEICVFLKRQMSFANRSIRFAKQYLIPNLR